MKKRIRKKLHLGEFKYYGNIVTIDSDGTEETAEAILNRLETLIDDYSLTVAGGGSGRLLVPAKKSNKDIPTLAATVVTAVAQEGLTEQMMFCIYVKGSAETPQSALDAIKDTFADRNVQVSKSMDLWQSI